MKAPVRGKKSTEAQKPNTPNNNKPTASAYAQDNGVSNVKAPLLGTQQQQQQYNTNGLDTEEAYQRQRLDDIEDIQVATSEVNALFKDFNTMVESQQPAIDTVEKNVDKSTDHVQKGTQELKKASEIQKCSRKWTCGFIVIIVVVVVIIVIVLYSQKKL
jgi:t-SNARE complex subunit (syntaxin)